MTVIITPLIIQPADIKSLELICRITLVKSMLNFEVSIFRLDNCRGKILSLISQQQETMRVTVFCFAKIIFLLYQTYVEVTLMSLPEKKIRETR